MFMSIFSPQHITHARIDESVEEIEDDAFEGCENLVLVETHTRIRRIGKGAFYRCCDLRRIDLTSVVEIVDHGFNGCKSLLFVEFGDKLESIGKSAFCRCPIEHLKLPSVVSIDTYAFGGCKSLIDVEFSDKLERVSSGAFYYCERLQRIAIPLKRNLLQGVTIFNACHRLTIVDLVGGVHKTVASLHMECWIAEMNTEINRINLLLPYTSSFQKTRVIIEWMDSVIDRMDHFRSEHCSCLKEAMTLLELALWKAKLDEKDDNFEESAANEVKAVVEDVRRKESRVTCGAETVIKNVVPFLQLLK